MRERSRSRLKGEMERRGGERERKEKGVKGEAEVKGRKERARVRGAALNTEGCYTRKSQARDNDAGAGSE